MRERCREMDSMAVIETSQPCYVGVGWISGNQELCVCVATSVVVEIGCLCCLLFDRLWLWMQEIVILLERLKL